MNEHLVFGTRGSDLALAQAREAMEAIRHARPGLELRSEVIRTSGDESAGAKAAKASGSGLKGMFTREVEEALLARRVDVAVHSMKDLPGHTHEHLAVAAVLPRAAAGDLLISREGHGLEELPGGAVVGTSSVRRARQVQRLRPDLQIVPLRGNVPTRLQKLRQNPQMTAIILAEAGFQRLSLSEYSAEMRGLKMVPLSGCLYPAIGQGIIALQVRAEDETALDAVRAVNDEPTWLVARLERELLRLLDGDCRLPVGVRTELQENRLHAAALLFHRDEDHSASAQAEGAADQPEELARLLFEKLKL